MQPVERISVLDQVINKLKEHIMNQGVSIGQKLPTEKEIGQMLNVGRSTVREAFRVLQTLGYIKIKQGVGAYVATKDDENPKAVARWFSEHGVEIADFLEVRMALEPLAVKLAVQRASEREITELEEIFRSFAEPPAKNDPIELALLDEGFHTTIAKASRNTLIMNINGKISEAFFEYRCKILSSEKYSANLVQLHSGILEAIKARDMERAEKEMAKHLEVSRKDLSEILGEQRS